MTTRTTPLELLRVLVARDQAHPSRLDAERWRSLADAAADVNASGALYGSCVRAHALDALPDDVRVRLKRTHAGRTAQNLELLHQSSRVLGRLRAAGIDAVPLKGVALFLRGVVQDLGARPTLDLDLLTRRRDRERVLGVLAALGFESTGVGGWPKHLPALRRGDLSVEVHEAAYWSRDGRRFGVDELRDAEGIPRLDRTAAHLVHHLYVSSIHSPDLAIKTLLDLHALAQHPSCGLERMEAACREAGLSQQLDDLRRTLDVAAGAEDAIDDRVRAVLDSCDPSRWNPQRAELRYFWNMTARSPVWMSALTLQSVFFPSRRTVEAIEGLPRGSPRVWLAYARRPARMAGKALRSLWRALR